MSGRFAIQLSEENVFDVLHYAGMMEPGTASRAMIHDCVGVVRLIADAMATDRLDESAFSFQRQVDTY